LGSTHPDERAERELEVVAELQAAEGVRQCERAGDELGDAFRSRIRQIVDGQNGDVVAGADAAVLTAVPGQAMLVCHRALLTL